MSDDHRAQSSVTSLLKSLNRLNDNALTPYFVGVVKLLTPLDCNECLTPKLLSVLKANRQSDLYEYAWPDSGFGT